MINLQDGGVDSKMVLCGTGIIAQHDVIGKKYDGAHESPGYSIAQLSQESSSSLFSFQLVESSHSIDLLLAQNTRNGWSE